MPQPDPYMELQPTDDKNRVYMAPTVKETTTEHDTYHQPVEVENESLYDYARPEIDNTYTSYEAVGVGGERQKRLFQSFKADSYMEPTVKETTTIEHTYFKTAEVENESLEYAYARPDEAVRVLPQSGERQYQNIRN